MGRCRMDIMYFLSSSRPTAGSRRQPTAGANTHTAEANKHTTGANQPTAGSRELTERACRELRKYMMSIRNRPGGETVFLESMKQEIIPRYAEIMSRIKHPQTIDREYIYYYDKFRRGEWSMINWKYYLKWVKGMLGKPASEIEKKLRSQLRLMEQHSRVG